MKEFTEEELRELHRMTGETPVGGCFEWDGVRYRVGEVNGTYCFGCALKDRLLCRDIACAYNERTDGKNVIFYEEEGGEE